MDMRTGRNSGEVGLASKNVLQLESVWVCQDILRISNGLNWGYEMCCMLGFLGYLDQSILLQVYNV